MSEVLARRGFLPGLDVELTRSTRAAVVLSAAGRGRREQTLRDRRGR